MSSPVGGDPLSGPKRIERGTGAGPRPKILCVDDELERLSPLTQLLEHDFEVVSMSSLEALSRLERDGDFAVVVASMNLPPMEGLDFLEVVKRLSPTSTRLTFTDSTGLDSARATPPSAAFRILDMHCSRELLLQIIEDAVSYHALVATSPVQPVDSAPHPHSALLPMGRAAGPRAQLYSQKGLLDITAALVRPLVVHDHWRGEALTSPVSVTRVGLRTLERTVELLPGLTIVGRSRTCHVPIDDPRVSRRHACFSNDGEELSVRNVSSTSTLLLNGISVLDQDPHQLRVGDRVTVGSHEIEVCTLGDYAASLEPTQGSSGRLGTSHREQAGETATLGTLANVAEKYVRLGQSRDAERILRPLLKGLLRYCESGEVPLLTDVKLAVDWALGIAESNRAGEWVTYVFKLFSALGLPVDQDVADRLYRIIPMVPGISMTSYRRYVETLGQLQERFGPAQRFLIRRIQGLEAALMASAHV